jgi:hypothetical protein
MPRDKTHHRKKGSEEIHTLSEFLNIPSIMNRARKNELRRLGITPINNFPQYVPPSPSPPKNLTPQQKKRFEESIARSLEWNNTNNNLKLFANLGNNSRNRIESNASDPKNLSRGSSPISFKGGRKTRKVHRRKHSRTRKH